MRILIIDDDKMICFALKTIIENEHDMEVVDMGHSYDDAISLFKKHQPDVALFDIRIGEKTGIDAFKEIKETHKDAKIIFLTTFLDGEYISDALKYRSCGYLLKDDFESICPSIRAVFAGQNVFGSKVLNNLSIDKSQRENINTFFSGEFLCNSLTEREIEVLHLISKGFNNKEIANKLFLSEGTVRNYISSLLEKLELRDRTQLAIYYLNAKK